MFLERLDFAYSQVACCVHDFQVIVPHGEAVTVETFLAWRERFEAELALERAK